MQVFTRSFMRYACSSGGSETPGLRPSLFCFHGNRIDLTPGHSEHTSRHPLHTQVVSVYRQDNWKDYENCLTDIGKM